MFAKLGIGSKINMWERNPDAVRQSHDIGDKVPKSLIYLNLSEFGKQLAGYHKQ